MGGPVPFPCGQCLPCRMNKRRVWSHRIMLEAAQYEENAFITLTYSDDALPPNGSLSPEHLSGWLKRFRKVLSPKKIRFYGVGEYGELEGRPHYHVMVFGYPACPYILQTLANKKQCGCAVCLPVYQSWGHGRILCGTVEPHSAQYVAGYVIKKMTSKDDPRLQNKHPEFSRQSNRPGIGYSAMHEVASTLMKLNLDSSQPDVPSALRHGNKILPLGRYLVRSLRKMVGKDEKTPASVLQLLDAELHEVRVHAFDNSLNLGEVIKDKSKNQLLSLENKMKIKPSKKGSL